MNNEEAIIMGNDTITLEKLRDGNQICIVENEEKTQCFYLNNKADRKQELPNSHNEENKILLVNMDYQTEITTIYPTYTRYGSSNFLKPKYNGLKLVFEGYLDHIEEREIDGSTSYIIEGLPEIFIKSLRYGLGILRDYKYIVEIARYIDNCKTLLFSRKQSTGINTRNNEDITIIINDSDLDKIRRGLDRTSSIFSKESVQSKQLFVYNEVLHSIDPKRFTERKKPGQKDIIYRIVKDTDFSRSMSSANKKALFKIKNDIDFGYFTALKTEFDKIIEGGSKETVFQKYFEKNPLLLTLFAGSPFIRFHNQAYVGGKSFDNKNGQYPDFLYKHKITNNNFIIEIKCPNTPLLENTPYRETGIYSPSKDLSGAVSQVLTQKYQLETNIASLIKDADDRNVEAYNVQGLLIIGLLSNLSGQDEKVKKRSFELFRNNQKNLRIMTYDECQEQLNFFLAEIYKNKELGKNDT